MPSVCFYFQVHQPWRLRHYRYSEQGINHDYFDAAANRAIFNKVAEKCYLPTNQKLFELIQRHDGRFRVAFSITGTAIEQMRWYAPEVLASFQSLVRTGCVELLAETYHHSLAAVYDETEFKAQVRLHTDLMHSLFGVRPRVFRNTELIYNDRIGELASEMGFEAVIAEGADDVLGWRSPNFVYQAARGNSKLLLKNYRLSDDIAFRFSNRDWPEWPLTAPKFASWIHALSGHGDTVNLFMDYETFGEHQWEATGIFAFLDHLPSAILAHSDWDFRTPSEVAYQYPAVAPLTFTRTVSWADIDRDLSAWQGNTMQRSALQAAFDLAEPVRRRNNPATTATWRKLLTSDHFYYMCTKWFADGDVHAYFSPYPSPYDAFVNYMNVLEDFRDSLLDHHPEKLAA